MIRITHFRSKCIGCNACVEANPIRWIISKKDGRSIMVSGINNKGIYNYVTCDVEYEPNKMAADNCPVKIIRVVKIQN